MNEIGRPVTIASNVEGVWCPPGARPSPYLGSSLWMNCGARGVKVWLPLHDNDDNSEKITAARRTLLTVNQSVYPLVIHHHEAAVLG